MKILLINTFWRVKEKHSIWKRVAGLTPPIGLMSIAAFLEKQGIEVDIIETNASEFDLSAFSKEFIQQYDFIGISATTNIINNAYTIIDYIKSLHPQSKIIVGGVHATIMPEEVMQQKNVDFVITGEGEQVLYDFLRTNDITKVPHVFYRNKGKVAFTHHSNHFVDIDTLPIPAYHKIDFTNYSLAPGSYKRLPGIGVVVSRGCPSLCTFCHGPLLGRNVRIRSVENIIQEIKLLRDTYHLKEIAFYDDNFTVYKQHTLEFCQRLIDEDIDITWSCFSKVTLVDEELLSIMKKAGCHQILYGIESGDPAILKNIKKYISLERIEQVIKLTKKHHIDVRAAFMLGNPGETEETIKKTIEFAIKLNPDRAIFNITTPFPGTEMYAWAHEHAFLLTTEWDKYDLSRPVMELPTVSSDTIMKYYMLSYRKFYFRLRYIMSQLVLLRNWRSFFTYVKIAIKLLYYT